MSLLAIDARMIRHSGIGVVLRGILGHWEANRPPFRLLLCGSTAALKRDLPPRLEADLLEWNPPLYSFSAALFPPSFPASMKPDAWYSPHYATCLRPGAPLVVHVQDVLHITHPTRRGTRVYNRVYLQGLRRRAAYILTTSRQVKVQLQTLFGFPADRVLRTSLGPGIDLSSPGAPLPAELEGRAYLLAVGIFKSHKNWPFLLAEFARLGLGDVVLACAGLGQDARHVAALARNCGIGDRVVLLPHLDTATLAAVYTNARALVYPSLAEGFGLPILEAMSCGTPVVCADRSPMNEIAGGAALLFDPDNPESFRRAATRVMESASLRESLAEKGRRRAGDFSWRRTTSVVEDAVLRTMTGQLSPAFDPGNE